MRLDHLLSKEEVGVGLLSRCQGVMRRRAYGNRCRVYTGRWGHMISGIRRTAEHEVMREHDRGWGSLSHDGVEHQNFWWRCAYGEHPYPSRTRRLRHKRPMVLYWRRYGRVGGCQIYLKTSRKALYRQLVLPVIKDENKIFSFLMTDKTVKSCY